ncbi:MAG: Re/Si-specific NAD(P)(+) transhydrogenase subunit alpha [Bacteroidetes bacterium]|nr:Re/Si-specific NAD(P)(+) transhydrogenase subunit alpha [Bacteroidota bacterium]
MTIGVLRESNPETRVSLSDEAVAFLIKKGFAVCVEQGAGTSSYCNDGSYQSAGAVICDRTGVMSNADVILAMHTIPADQLVKISGKLLIGAYQPLYKKDWVQSAAQAGVTCFSLDMLPRTTRAQSMDILSSQANIAGYKAVLLGATTYGRYFPMFMTAAGSIAPAKVLILGAGVAGLQAIATAKRLGAVVEVFDTRPAVKEEVMSLGAKFIEVEGSADASKAGGYAVEQSEDYQQRQRERIAQSAAKADIIITTAQIPGKKAPILITAEMIASMRNGSVIIDLAASTGGNTPYTKDGETVDQNGVRIVGASSLPATLPADASKLYGKNVLNFFQLLIDKTGAIQLNWEDDLVKGACITHQGKIVNEKIASSL